MVQSKQAYAGATQVLSVKISMQAYTCISDQVQLERKCQAHRRWKKRTLLAATLRGLMPILLPITLAASPAPTPTPSSPPPPSPARATTAAAMPASASSLASLSSMKQGKDGTTLTSTSRYVWWHHTHFLWQSRACSTAACEHALEKGWAPHGESLHTLRLSCPPLSDILKARRNVGAN